MVIVGTHGFFLSYLVESTYFLSVTLLESNVTVGGSDDVES